MKGEPTPNRVQSSVLELPRCEGGKYRKAGLKEKEAGATQLFHFSSLYSSRKG
jgi:hypothetical protein